MNEIDEVSERIERAALISLHEHCPPEAREALGLFLEEVGDGIACGASKDPSVLLNRTLGLGTRAPVTTETLQAITKVYADRGVERYFVHVYPDTVDGGEAAFADTTLKRARGWMKFQRAPDAAPEAKTELRVEAVGPEGAADFGRIVALAFGMTEAGGPLLAGLVNDPRWTLFVSYDGDQAAGAGALFVDDGAAWFEWGATDPAFRRRGSQGAIMCARIEKALELGCKHLFTETGEAVGGDPQHSYRNIQRYGFAESVLRENWSPVG
jgi:GNAT superfamily N-acetyltransferase